MLVQLCRNASPNHVMLHYRYFCRQVSSIRPRPTCRPTALTPTLRHARLGLPPPISAATPYGKRHLSWLPKFGTKQSEQFEGPSDNQEEAAKIAILEKAMKGRQPTDLMLRCTCLYNANCLDANPRQAPFLMQRVTRLRLFAFESDLRWCALGNVQTISGQFKKSDLCTEHRLNVCLTLTLSNTRCSPLCSLEIYAR